jgi:hypothetical protein
MEIIAVEAMTAPNELPFDIVERAMHASPSEWLFFRELRVGTGSQPESAESGYICTTLCGGRAAEIFKRAGIEP